MSSSLAHQVTEISPLPRHSPPARRPATQESLERFYRGDEAYFRRLVNGLSPDLRRYVRAYVHDPDLAEDILQDVWTAVFVKRHQYRSAGSLRGWIRGIVRNTCLMTLRSRRAERRWTSWLDHSAVPECPYRACEQADIRELVGVALAALSVRERAVVRGRMLEGRSAVELSRELRCPAGTVRATLHRASRKLRAALAKSRPPTAATPRSAVSVRGGGLAPPAPEGGR